jgi:hypothetical protein
MSKDTRFTLVCGEWYAADFIGDDVPGSMADGYGYSPIYVYGVVPMKSGKGVFELSFFHANYPEGVSDKVYALRTLHRGETYLLACSIDHQPVRFLCIHRLTAVWARKHFSIDEAVSIDEWLGRFKPAGVVQS